jgi:hypothetical protein
MSLKAALYAITADDKTWWTEEYLFNENGTPTDLTGKTLTMEINGKLLEEVKTGEGLIVTPKAGLVKAQAFVDKTFAGLYRLNWIAEGEKTPPTEEKETPLWGPFKVLEPRSV